jgi:hypothetical protein
MMGKRWENDNKIEENNEKMMGKLMEKVGKFRENDVKK